VIGALQDTDGSITVPLNVAIERGKVDKGAVMSSAVSALGSIVATAIASAPVKAMEDVTNVIGLGAILGGNKQKAEIEPVELEFGTGDVTLGPAEQRKIASLVELMRKDATVELTGRHELGNGDLELARTRANPGPTDALALARAVQSRKQQLIAARADLAARARLELAALSNDGRASATLDELRSLDRQIAAADDGADALFDLLRPGAERQSDRRARAAALQVAQQRLAAVRDDAVAMAKASNVPFASERIRMTNAQLNPSSDIPAGGRVIITVVRKKRQ
jgi:hypothetical protein